jgi:hypothetical protein
VVETRAVAATALQGMVTRDDVQNAERNIVQLMMSEGVLEAIFCGFMRSRHPLLEERGAKGAAHLAIVKSRQVTAMEKFANRDIKVWHGATGNGP